MDEFIIALPWILSAQHFLEWSSVKQCKIRPMHGMRLDAKLVTQTCMRTDTHSNTNASADITIYTNTHTHTHTHTDSKGYRIKQAAPEAPHSPPQRHTYRHTQADPVVHF